MPENGDFYKNFTPATDYDAVSKKPRTQIKVLVDRCAIAMGDFIERVLPLYFKMCADADCVPAYRVTSMDRVRRVPCLLPAACCVLLPGVPSQSPHAAPQVAVVAERVKKGFIPAPDQHINVEDNCEHDDYMKSFDLLIQAVNEVSLFAFQRAHATCRHVPRHVPRRSIRSSSTRSTPPGSATSTPGPRRPPRGATFSARCPPTCLARTAPW